MQARDNKNGFLAGENVYFRLHLLAHTGFSPVATTFHTNELQQADIRALNDI